MVGGRHLIARRIAKAITAIALALPGNAMAQSLSETIRASLDLHPSIGRAEAEFRASREAVAKARADYRPTITLVASISSSTRDSELQTGESFSEDTRPSSASIEVNQTLYSGGIRPIVGRRATLSVRAARFGIEDAELLLTSEVIDIYLDLLFSSEAAEIERDIEALLQEQLIAALARERSGLGTRTEIAQLEGRLAGSNAAVISAEARVSQARSRLAAYSGLQPTTVRLPQLPNLPAGSVEAALMLAREKSPALKDSRIQEEIARLDSLAAGRQTRPQVTLSLSASTGRETNPAIDRDDDLRATLGVSVPLYAGGRYRSDRREALARRNQARFAAEALRLDLDLAVIDAWLRAQAAEASRQAQSRRVAISEEALRGVTRAREAGLASLTDILTATEDLQNARRDEAAARRELFSSRLQLALLCGTLDL